MNRVHSLLAPLSFLVSGLIFGIGLIVSGMINPAKVIGFLDIAGAWDPSLILVMVGGIAIATPAFRFILKREQPLFEAKFYLPTSINIDGKLIAGAALFGVGWGIAGLCPGPGLTGVTSMNGNILIFVVAMLAGMAIFRFLFE